MMPVHLSVSAQSHPLQKGLPEHQPWAKHPCMVALGHPVHSLLEPGPYVPLCLVVLFMRFSSPVALKTPLDMALPRLIYLYTSNAWQ